MKNYYVIKKAKRNGFLSIRDAAKFKGVPVNTIIYHNYKFNHLGSALKIKFDKKFIEWRLYKRNNKKIGVQNGTSTNKTNRTKFAKIS